MQIEELVQLVIDALEESCARRLQKKVRASSLHIWMQGVR